MECQDWTTVTIKKRITKRDAVTKGMATTMPRDADRSERARLAKLDTDDIIIPKKRVTSLSIQELIRARIGLCVSQDKGDGLCSFPKHTIKEIEANRLIPTEEQKRRIQQIFGVTLKVETY